jgi:two-component system, cell cycle sensor histidine kinase and response regulator CckA
MKKVLNLLYLEDSHHDFELIRELLIEAGYNFHIDRVETGKEYISLLRTRTYDIILADFKLHGFDAFASLNLAMDTCPVVPFICVSGSIGEDTAIELIKRGAVDYVLKDKPERLPLAIQRALEEAEGKKARKRAEQELTALNLLHQAILAAVPDIIMQVDTNKVYTWANKAGIDFFGDDVIGKEASNYFEGDQVTYSVVQPLFNGKDNIIYVESWQRRIDGERRLLGWWCRVLKDGGGNVIGALSSARDITERNRMEEALVSSESKYRSFFENSMDAILLTVPDGKILSANPAACRMFGYSEDELITMGRAGIVDMSDHQLTALLSKRALTGTAHGELKFIRKNGLRFPAEVSSAIFKSLDGKEHTSMIIRDITERKEAEAALFESEMKYRTLVTQSPDGIFVVDLSGAFLSVNKAMCDTLHYSEEELLSMKIWDIVPQQYLLLHKNRLADVLKGISNKNAAEYEVKGKDGIVHLVEVLSTPYYKDKEIIGFQGIARDITQRRAMEDQLRQMQKLEGLGTLAGGIAHDFNNILGIILAYITSIKWFKEDARKSELATDAITKAVQRGKTLVNQILTFARKSETEFTPVDINDIVVEIMTMIHETFPKVLTYSQNIDKNIPFIQADRSQLHQAVLNLCVNARDAMPNGGVLALNTLIVTGSNLTDRHPDTLADKYVCIEVSDTGVGISEDIRNRIFEPFFTTKEKGKGTGLGLAVVFGIVQTHKGFIDVESEPGTGTTFRLYLPAIQTLEPVTVEVEEPIEKIPGGTETLLVVEDEENLMIPLLSILGEKGYTVVSTEDGLAAVKIYEERKNEINLVITDLGIPKISGMDVCKRIHHINPAARTIVATGFLDPDMKSELLKTGVRRFVAKPYNPKEILEAIRQVLDSK